MKLIVKNPSVPIKAIPKNDLQQILEGDFATWISNLLGLTGEDSAKRLIIALPAIEKHFWSLGFNEIQKAFTMYVDGELKTQPLTNYLDRVLVGKIFKEYKELQRTKVKPMNETQYKAEQDRIWVIQCFDRFIQDRKIDNQMVWVYTYLERQINASKRDKEILFQMGKDQKLSKEDAIKKSKLTLLRRYFEKLEAKGQHIKDLI